MANQWFKFYGSEYLSDPKFLGLGAYERSCWITLLSLASQTENGEIKFLSESQLFALSGINPVENSKLQILEKFAKLDMIRIGNGTVTVLNWNKRQYSEGYSRVRKFRDKNSNANVTAKITTERKKERKNSVFNENARTQKPIYQKAPDYKDFTGLGQREAAK